MSIFADVKAAVPARTAVLHYGIHVNRQGFALCPFHNDRHPSMKVDKRFHCFGCQADGDAIDFTALYFNLKPLDAAKKLADDFGIPYDDEYRRPVKIQPKPPPEDNARDYYNMLCGWLHILSEWQTEYAPEDPDAEWDERFIAALKYRSQLEYALDEIFLNPAAENDRKIFVTENKILLDTLQDMLEYVNRPE